MCDHRPPAERVQRQADDGDRVVLDEPHRQQADGSERVRPGDHLVQVGNIGGALFLLQLLPQRPNLFRKGTEVELLQPFIFLGQLALLEDSSLGVVLDEIGSAHLSLLSVCLVCERVGQGSEKKWILLLQLGNNCAMTIVFLYMD